MGMKKYIFDNLISNSTTKVKLVNSIAREIQNNCSKITNEDELILLPLNELDRNFDMLVEEMKLGY